MDALDAIRSRVSVRNFEPRPIPRMTLYRILDAARWAPSAGNLQSWEFLVVTEPEIKAKIASACLSQDWIATAPTLVVVCADTERSALKYGGRGKYFYSVLEVSAAVENILIAATAEDVGSCFVAGFDEPELKRALALPEAVMPIAVVPLGYTSETPHHPQRADLSNSVHFERYGNFEPKKIPADFKGPTRPASKQRKSLLGIFD